MQVVIYVHMCMYIHMCIHRCVSSWCTRRCIFSVQEHVCVYVCTYLCVCIYIWARASVCVCASTSTFAPPVHECMHACLLAYKCKNICMYIYIYRERECTKHARGIRYMCMYNYVVCFGYVGRRGAVSRAQKPSSACLSTHVSVRLTA